MLANIRDIYWLAGLLEGEAYFGLCHTSPVVQLAMTDQDIVERAHSLTCATSKVKSYMPRGHQNRRVYRFSIHGARAVGLMLTLYSLFGARRQEKVRSTLKAWKSTRRKRVLNLGVARNHPEYNRLWKKVA